MGWKLDRIDVTVTDMERMRAFYEAVFDVELEAVPVADTFCRKAALPGLWELQLVPRELAGFYAERNRHQLKHVPQGQCWVEGDNADASRDSNAFGPVPLALLTGVVSYVVWPPWRARRIPSHVPAQVGNDKGGHQGTAEAELG